MINFRFGRSQKIVDRIGTRGALIYSDDKFLSRMFEDTLHKLGADLCFTIGDPDAALDLLNENQIDMVFMDIRHAAIRPGMVLRQLGFIPGYHIEKLIFYFIGEPTDIVLPKELHGNSRFIKLPISSSQMLLRLANDLLPEKSAKLRKINRRDRRILERGTPSYYDDILDQLTKDVVKICNKTSDRDFLLHDAIEHVKACLCKITGCSNGECNEEFFRKSRAVKRARRFVTNAKSVEAC